MDDNRVIQYIEANWDSSVKQVRSDKGNLIGMPYPYTVPAVGYYDEIYYWDAFFANLGLAESDRWDLVKSNTDNMLFLVEKYGFVPNGNRTYYLGNSQPPLLSEMVRQVFEHYGDYAWLKGAYSALKKEYDFWMSSRVTPTGLNRYGGRSADKPLNVKASDFCRRIQYRPPDKTDQQLVDHYLLCCEAGWDLTPRFGFEGWEYAQIDLNSLLYLLEKNMAKFATFVAADEEALWKERAERRNALVQKYMLNGGLFYDYNFVNSKFSDIFSAASLYPLFVGLATPEQAEKTVNNLYRLEAEYGIFACEKNDVPGEMRWNYPSGCSCLEYIAVRALDNYGYKEEAMRLAEKGVRLIEKVFDETGCLWEKYNVVEGNTNVLRRATMPSMMGRIAGAYMLLKKYVRNKSFN